MHIGILQTGHVAETLIPEHGDYDTIFPAFLDGFGFTFTNYAVVDMEFPEGPDVAGGWLIKVKVGDGAMDGLLDAAAYEEVVVAES